MNVRRSSCFCSALCRSEDQEASDPSKILASTLCGVAEAVRRSIADVIAVSEST